MQSGFPCSCFSTREHHERVDQLLSVLLQRTLLGDRLDGAAPPGPEDAVPGVSVLPLPDHTKVKHVSPEPSQQHHVFRWRQFFFSSSVSVRQHFEICFLKVLISNCLSELEAADFGNMVSDFLGADSQTRDVKRSQDPQFEGGRGFGHK